MNSAEPLTLDRVGETVKAIVSKYCHVLVKDLHFYSIENPPDSPHWLLCAEALRNNVHGHKLRHSRSQELL